MSIADKMWLDRMRDFIRHVRGTIIPLADSDVTFRQCVRSLICGNARCNNLPEWTPGLNRDFFNWMCHKTEHIGFEQLQISRRTSNGLGNPFSAAFRAAVKTLVEEACACLPSRGRRARIVLASRSFYLAFLARDTRHMGPESTLTASICGEAHNGAHTYQRELMKQLNIACEQWIQET